MKSRAWMRSSSAGCWREVAQAVNTFPNRRNLRE
jgi:hypothetical protein